jgi:hypothetical protein
LFKEYFHLGRLVLYIKKEFVSVLYLPENVRYEYLVKQVINNEQIGGLNDDGKFQL